MDYSALAELVVFSLLGLSILFLAIGFSVRAFLGPVLRDLFGRGVEVSAQDVKLLVGRLEHLEDRLDHVEGSLERIEAAQTFDRKLEGPKLG